MENKFEITLTIFLMALVTGVIRVIPTIILGNKKLTKDIHLFLSFAPLAILFAMLSPSIVLKNGDFNFSFANEYFWVSIPTILLAWYYRSIALTVVSGVSLLALWRLSQ